MASIRDDFSGQALGQGLLVALVGYASSVAIVIQAEADSGASAATASAMSARGSAASVNAKLKPAAEVLRKSRRLNWLFMA